MSGGNSRFELVTPAPVTIRQLYTALHEQLSSELPGAYILRGTAGDAAYLVVLKRAEHRDYDEPLYFTIESIGAVTPCDDPETDTFSKFEIMPFLLKREQLEAVVEKAMANLRAA